MQWRLNLMTIVAEGILIAVIVFAGASVVRNVTGALEAVVAASHTGILPPAVSRLADIGPVGIPRR